MKRIITSFCCFLVLLLFSCSGGTGNSKKNWTRIIPKLTNTTFLSQKKVYKAASLKEETNASDSSVQFDYDHLFICDIKYWIQLVCKLSAPVFNGFEYRDYESGDVFESEFYGKTVTTTITETDDTVEFSGDFNDGGGYYKLIINKTDNTFTFEQRLIADTVLVQPVCLDYPIDDPNRGSYVAQVARYCIFSTASGIINGTDCDGTGISKMAELNSSNVERGEIRSADDFDITVSSTWINGTGMVYDFKFKSRDSFYGMRNNVPGQLRYQFNNFTVDHSSDTPSYSFDLSDIGYLNNNFWDVLKILDTFPQPPDDWDAATYGSYGSFQCQLYGPNCDYIVYMTNDGWQPVIWCGSADDGNTQSQELIDEKLAEIESIWAGADSE